MRSRFSAGVVLALAISFGACAQGEAPPDPKLWTLFDAAALLAKGVDPSHPLAPNAGLPGGIPLGQLLDGSALVTRDAWHQDYPTSYVTTEVWSSFDRVWMQPAYVPITGWQGGVPTKLLGDDGKWHPIFSVGPHSAFYSPFWQILYVEVPDGTPSGALTSARQILEADYPLTPGEGRTMPLTPDGITGGGKPGNGYLDGGPISFLDFGTATFTWNEENVVQEIPLYVFTVMGGDGLPHAYQEMPRVLGTAPPGSPSGPPPTVGGDGATPRYSAFWRIYTVPVPRFATIFAPPLSSLGVALTNDHATPSGQQYSDEILAATTDDFASFLGRVSVDMVDPNTGLPSCFDSLTTLSTCSWLEIQADLEAKVDLSTTAATGITVTAPVVSAGGEAILPL